MSDAIYRHGEVEARRTDAPWGVLRWIAGGEIANATGLTLGRVIIKAGHANPRHAHPGCEEVLYLLAGRLEHTLGDETHILEPGDAITIAAGVFHNAKALGEKDAEMIVAFDSAERDFVLEAGTDGSEA